MPQFIADAARGPWAGRKQSYFLEGVAQDYGSALRDLVQPWGDLYNTWVDAIRSKSRMPDHHAHDCRCPRCQPDDCHCRCCIVDADLVVRTRVGEHRIVPIVIENNLRREREVELQLSSWSSPSADIKVTGAIEPSAKFVLKACEEKLAILTVNVAPEKRDNSAAHAPDCLVFYADLRVLGCDLRSIRIAVAVLPLDCDAFHVDCRCVCCC